VLAAVFVVYFALPLVALLLGQSPVATLRSIGDPVVVSAAVDTLLTATASTALAVVLGIPLARWLASTAWRGRRLVTGVVVFPLILPPVVAGMLLVSVFGGPGFGGVVGLRLDGTLVGVVLAQTFVAAPFVVLPARSAFASQDGTLVEAAWIDGATEWRAFRRLTLPLAAPAILAGSTLAFARAAGEFGATLMIAYTARTLPVEVWVGFQRGGLAGAYPIAALLVVVSVAALAVVRFLGGSLTVDLDR
jgi:molybdate/tungstate transport system permease protein